MAMAGPWGIRMITAMPDPAALHLVHWLSPAFPIGGFAYSHGLEQVIADGGVTDAVSLEHWLSDMLRHGTGWQDSVLMAQALRRGADLDMLDAFASALQPCAERLQESREQGAAFARTVGAITDRALAPRCLPITVAEAAAPLGLPVADVIAAYLQGFTTNLVTIAIRHVPLGQSAGHGVLSRLLPLFPDIGARAAESALDDLGSSCFAAELAAFTHETKETRLFRT